MEEEEKYLIISVISIGSIVFFISIIRDYLKMKRSIKEWQDITLKIRELEIRREYRKS